MDTEKLDDEYWEHLLRYVESFEASIESLEDDELFNDRREDS